ncbi:MAG: ribosomal protein S18-alanine N-acetyltransferase [Nitrospirae bacterium]|nr:ribosomal protein S18-alanine N-acetyltransferase [Nitrospirota bacterium]
MISDMTGPDVARVIEIEKLSFTHKWSLNDFTSEVLNPDSICKMACLGDGRAIAIGYICVRMMVDEAHILRLAVHPAFRQRRVGSLLVKYIKDEVLRDFKGKIILEVRMSNMAAIRLYDSLGFKNLYIRRHYYAGPEEDAIVMAFDLDNRGWPIGESFQSCPSEHRCL